MPILRLAAAAIALTVPLPLASAAAAAASPPSTCARPVASDEAAARRIAEDTISARPRTGLNYFVVNIIPAPGRPDQWFAYQSVIPGTPSNGRAPAGTRAYGGLAMNIDRCTGAVSDLHFQR